MSELERERHKNVGLERARDSWYQEWFRGTERIAELEAEFHRWRLEMMRALGMADSSPDVILTVIKMTVARAEQAEAALAERDRMLRQAWDQTTGTFLQDRNGWTTWQHRKSFDEWLADLRARAEEGGE